MTATAHAEIMRMLHASLVTQALAVAAELGIADLVASEALDIDELAKRSGADPGALYRMLRALTAAGVFAEVAPRVFGATSLSDVLRRDAEGSLRNWARLWGIPERQAAVGALLHSVRTGQASFPHLHGRDWWTHLAANPESAAVFADAMGDLSRRVHSATVEVYDLSAARSLVDVGGGHGHLVAALLRRYPDLRATVFDEPGVVVHAAEVLSEAGVADRAKLIGGDFFTSVPAGADTYLMSMIMHDWDDEPADTILTNVRRAMSPEAELLIVDAILPEGVELHDGKLRDLIMLTMLAGRERTEAEFAALLARNRLRLRETRAVASSTGLLVAVPV